MQLPIQLTTTDLALLCAFSQLSEHLSLDFAGEDPLILAAFGPRVVARPLLRHQLPQTPWQPFCAATRPCGHHMTAAVSTGAVGAAASVVTLAVFVFASSTLAPVRALIPTR